jgi:predicted nucleic acid-binding protein
VSEWKRRQPDPGVLAWLEALEHQDVWLSVLTVGELAKGILRLPDCPRRSELQGWLFEFCELYREQVLPVSDLEVLAWAEISAETEAAGTVVAAVDGLLAGTARAHGLPIATRNTQDFLATGVPLYDPWTGAWCRD